MEDKGRKIAVVAYVTIIGTVIAMLMNNEHKSPFASFHIRQALGIFFIFFITGYFIGYFDSWTITTAFWLSIFVLWIYGFTSALQGRQNLVPVLGKYFQRWFKNL